MASSENSTHFSAAIGHRYDFLQLIDGTVKADGLKIDFPPVTKGAPSPIFSRLARHHPWDIGEQGFSTFLQAFDLGKPQIALPVFPSRFFPHAGLWVRTESKINGPDDLVGKRIGCGSFGTNYSVWLRGVLTHQYDVPVEKITWIESVEPHLPEYQPPRRFAIEQIDGNQRAGVHLLQGTLDAAQMAGAGHEVDLTATRPLFPDHYSEIRKYAEQNGFFPINTIITVRKDAVARNTDMPHLMMDAFVRAKTLYDNKINSGEEDEHMGLSLRTLKKETGLGLPAYGYKDNLKCIEMMIAYCYEQGIIRRLIDPAELFAITDR